MSATDVTDLPPPATRRRTPGLDVVRGIAIIGTLAANIWLFQAFSGTPVTASWWADVLREVTAGKFLGLLTIVFGIGLEIQRQAAVRRGRPWPGAYLVRMVLLFCDGVLNYIFLVQFDVLRAYAVVGFVVAFVLLLRPRWQWVFAWAALAVHAAHLAVFAVLPGLYEQLPSLVLPGEFPVYEGRPTYWQTVHESALTVFSDFSPGADTGTIITLGLFAFTCGALLYRNGIFDDRGARLRRWLMVVGLGIGVPLDAAVNLTAEATGIGGRFVTSPLVAFGILALVAHVYRDRTVGFVGRRLSAVGRMALSCYVLQNLLGRVLQGFVLDSPLSGALDPVLGTLVMFVVIALVVVAFAEVWLRVFGRGPLEAVWDVVFRAITSNRGPAGARGDGRS